MKKPAIPRSLAGGAANNNERGVTMVLVAVAMVAIVAMAALSIDIVTLYLAREEAQRSADAAALAAARVLSVSGITGDPSNSTGNWGTNLRTRRNGNAGRASRGRTEYGVERSAGNN